MLRWLKIQLGIQNLELNVDRIVNWLIKEIELERARSEVIRRELHKLEATQRRASDKLGESIIKQMIEEWHCPLCGGAKGHHAQGCQNGAFDGYESNP